MKKEETYEELMRKSDFWFRVSGVFLVISVVFGTFSLAMFILYFLSR